MADACGTPRVATMSPSIMSSPDSSPPSVAQPSGSDAISVVLADDHQVVRSGLRVLLESDGRFNVVGEAGDVVGTARTVCAARPRVLVLDLNMGGESSLDAIPQLRADVPETQIVR